VDPKCPDASIIMLRTVTDDDVGGSPLLPHALLPGNKITQNYWLQAFLAAHLHITKYFNAIMEEAEKVPEWLTTGIRREQGS